MLNELLQPFTCRIGGHSNRPGLYSEQLHASPELDEVEKGGCLSQRGNLGSSPRANSASEIGEIGNSKRSDVANQLVRRFQDRIVVPDKQILRGFGSLAVASMFFAKVVKELNQKHLRRSL